MADVDIQKALQQSLEAASPLPAGLFERIDLSIKQSRATTLRRRLSVAAGIVLAVVAIGAYQWHQASLYQGVAGVPVPTVDLVEEELFAINAYVNGLDETAALAQLVSDDTGIE